MGWIEWFNSGDALLGITVASNQTGKIDAPN